MPYGDGTGPMGLGPRTGRRMGLCSGYPVRGSRLRGEPDGWYPHGQYNGGRGRGFRRRLW